MTRSSLSRAAIGALLPLAVAACAAEDPAAAAELGTSESAISPEVCPAGVPPELAPAPDQHLAFVLSATGVQKYNCAAGEGGHAWKLVAPEADLFRRDHPVGTHFAGPTWKYQDGSTVVAALAAGAQVDARAIPWLLLTATDHGGDDGKMTRVSAIQRLSTSGGLAPATGCDADHDGAAVVVPYSADYFFYRTRTKHPERNVRCGD